MPVIAIRQLSKHPRINSTQQQIRDFRTKFGMPLRMHPSLQWVSPEGWEKHLKFMREEIQEIEDAQALPDEVDRIRETIDGFCDLLVFMEHALWDSGHMVLFDMAYRIVNTSNISKGDDETGEHFDPATGKLKKGPKYVRPDLGMLFNGYAKLSFGGVMTHDEGLAFVAATLQVHALQAHTVKIYHPDDKDNPDWGIPHSSEITLSSYAVIPAERASFLAKVAALEGKWMVELDDGTSDEVYLSVNPTQSTEDGH